MHAFLFHQIWRESRNELCKAQKYNYSRWTGEEQTFIYSFYFWATPGRVFTPDCAQWSLRWESGINYKWYQELNLGQLCVNASALSFMCPWKSKFEEPQNYNEFLFFYDSSGNLHPRRKWAKSWMGHLGWTEMLIGKALSLWYKEPVENISETLGKHLSFSLTQFL